MKRREAIVYAILVAALFAVSLLAGWSWNPLAARIDNYAYDWLMALDEPPSAPPQSIILAIDEKTMQDTGGVGFLRAALAEGLERIAPAKPKVVAIDVLLADSGIDSQNARLEAALSRVPAVVLPADMPGGEWEFPLARFRKLARAVGHVHFAPDRYDGVSRELALEKAVGPLRLWALSLETFRWYTGGGQISESLDDFEVGGRTVPGSRRHEMGRPILIAYLRPQDGRPAIPQVSVAELRTHPERAKEFAGRAVFAGVTALSATRDRAMTPFDYLTGVEIHAQAFETIAGGRFLKPASSATVILVCLLLAASAGAIFAFITGWPAYAAGAALLIGGHVLPHVLFSHSVVFPYFAPALTTWLSVSGAASFQYFIVRRQLRKSESDKARYQQAIHFVVHEMRSPLTAIQGSSELMGRYNLNEDKRKQIAGMINSESKRLARMIQNFLDVERLTEGQVSLRKAPVALHQVVETCVGRARPLAERKQIRLQVEPVAGVVSADRELLEYAVYNLLNNAVKYSPADTVVTVAGRADGSHVRLDVRDQGIGMDDKELKNIFRKFYRTKRAEASGEAGTGIGLSLVDQIVGHHGGKMEVTSAPGKGSCFTIVLPASASAPPTDAGRPQDARSPSASGHS
jgi:signal transduction histidine kinase